MSGLGRLLGAFAVGKPLGSAFIADQEFKTNHEYENNGHENKPKSTFKFKEEQEFQNTESE